MCALAARMGDPTAHGGIIVFGWPMVLIEGRPAARVSDMHVCPMVTPPAVPHVGGPILPPGAVTVLIGNLPAARLGDWAVCVGPIDVIVMGAVTVDIGPAAMAPPMPPSISTPGGGGDSDKPEVYKYKWFVNWVAWVNAAIEWNVGALVSIAAGAVGAVAVGLVFWVAVVKVRDSLPARGKGAGHGAAHPTALRPDMLVVDEGVREDAPVYFL
jgi:uncharacterized Zn-binding protein involved in type VI secretion